MRKEKWYDFVNWPKSEQALFPFRLINSDNIVTLYTASEEKKYRTAEKKQKAKLLKEELINA